jgi:hypothetical protein
VKTPETETFSWTVTCPPPPPPPEPDVAEPPAPPPPTARMSALETPDGTDQEQLVKFVKVKIVNPPEVVLEGEHAAKEEVIETTFESVPPVFVAVTV